jgi:large subunit ribosomal protein L10
LEEILEKRATVIRPAKVAEVDELAERLARATMAVLADYRGLTVAQMGDLRRQLRPVNVELRVAKNTLTRLAARKAGREALLPALEGPTALVFSYGDPAAMAKTLTDTVRVQRLALQVKGALLGDRLLAGPEVARIADLPSRETLLAQLMGGVQAPITSLVSLLAGTLQNLVGVLDARRQQLEAAG